MPQWQTTTTILAVMKIWVIIADLVKCPSRVGRGLGWRGKRVCPSTECSRLHTLYIILLLTCWLKLFMWSHLSTMGPKWGSYSMSRRQRAGNTWRAALMITTVVVVYLKVVTMSSLIFFLGSRPVYPLIGVLHTFSPFITQFTLLWIWSSFVSLYWCLQLSAVFQA